MWTLAANLSVIAGRTVIDRTGFSGTFHYDLTWPPELLPNGLNGADTGVGLPADLNRPPLATALQEQLGLKLESTKGPVEVLAIDSVSQPTPD
jgi:uncharacterized protein (TIGR03435 family)